MYRSILRPILFLMKPEFVHHFIVWTIKLVFRIPGVSFIIRKFNEVRNPKLYRNFCGISFKNPVGLAAGFDKNAKIFNEFSNFGFSFIEIGTVTPKPQPGNPKPRSFRIIKDKALVNRMGFNNAGLKKIIANLKKKKTKIIIGGNIGKNTQTPNELAINDYEICFKELYNFVDYFVVNVSCPNIASLKELQDKDFLFAVFSRLKDIRTKQPVYKPILLKISPDLNNNQLDEIIEIVNKTKIDGIVATNTTTTREGLITSPKIIEKIGNGGLSGKPLNKRSTEIIRYLSNKSNGNIPIIGVGGIITPEEAIEKIEAGATLIQIYTGFIYNGPGFVKKINKAILNHIK